MIIKKFIGKNEIEATELARKELGENLVIMTVKKVRPTGPFSIFKKKQVEVTAALEDEEEPIRQIRKIAQAQDAAQKKSKDHKPVDVAAQVAAAGLNASLSAKSEKKQETVSTSNDGATEGVRVDLRADEPVRLNVSQENSSIEKKLDTLQTFLESRFVKEYGQGSASEESAEVKEKESEEKSESEKEMDKFIKLLYNTMIDNEVSEKLANEIMQDADKARKPGASLDYLLSAIYQKMILKFGMSEGLLPAKEGPKVVFFIGPTGVGKTTTIAKIASSLSVNDKKRVALLTTDTYRIAATEQLRTYAGILEVPFRVIYSEDELAVALSDFMDRDYIFIDTAGHSHKNEEFMIRQKNYMKIIEEQAEYQSFLVVSATTKYRDLLSISETYKDFTEAQLIFTKLDETDCLGNLYNLRIYSGRPIAYVTCGQNVPDDIEVFSAQKTVKQLLGGKRQ